MHKKKELSCFFFILEREKKSPRFFYFLSNTFPSKKHKNTKPTKKHQESVDMPVLFYVDPEIDDDPRLAGIDTVTLSYTFFLVDDGKNGGGGGGGGGGEQEAKRGEKVVAR